MMPPTLPCPSVTMSMNALRSRLSAIARRSSELSKGGTSRLTSRLRATLPGASSQIACGNWFFTILHQRHRDAAAEGHVDVTGNERQYRRRQIADDRILDPVEIWPARLPVIEVFCYFDR